MHKIVKYSYIYIYYNNIIYIAVYIYTYIQQPFTSARAKGRKSAVVKISTTTLKRKLMPFTYIHIYKPRTAS